MALFFIGILYLTAPAIGSMARLNLTNTVQIGVVGDAEGNLFYEERPEWFRTWESTGLLTFEDKNNDGRVQYYDDSNPDFEEQANAFGWQGNELVIDRDIMVLANPEIANLPAWVIALIAAGGVAAALSTAAGLLLVISSSISHDLLKGVIAPSITESQELFAGRISAAVAIGIAGLLGYYPPAFVAQVVAFAFGLAAASLFPVLMLGIFTKTINKEGAIAGMLTGLIFTYGYIEFFKGLFLQWAGTPFAADTPDNWIFGISPEGIGIVGMILNITVAVIVSKLTNPPPEEVQNLVEEIRHPQ